MLSFGVLTNSSGASNVADQSTLLDDFKFLKSSSGGFIHKVYEGAAPMGQVKYDSPQEICNFIFVLNCQRRKSDKVYNYFCIIYTCIFIHICMFIYIYDKLLD